MSLTQRPRDTATWTAEQESGKEGEERTYEMGWSLMEVRETPFDRGSITERSA
jgi:hypothetical protein